MSRESIRGHGGKLIKVVISRVQEITSNQINSDQEGGQDKEKARGKDERESSANRVDKENLC